MTKQMEIKAISVILDYKMLQAFRLMYVNMEV